MPNPLHSPQYEVFRRLLVKARQESGLTQVEVAERLGKPQSFVSKIERGERRLDFPEFIQLADALGVDPEEFIRDYRQALEDQREVFL